MKKTGCLLIVLLLLTIACAGAENTFVDDAAGLMSAAQQMALEEKIEKMYDETGIGLYIVTRRQIGYQSAELYSTKYYRENGGGKAAPVFLVVMSDRSYDIYVPYGKAGDTLEMRFVDRLEKIAVANLKNDSYYKAFDSVADAMIRHLQAPKEEAKERLVEALPVVGLISAVIALIIVLVIKGKMRSIRNKPNATDYVKTFRLTGKRDIYLYTTTRRVRIETNDSGSGGSHSGGSGGSHHSGHF